MTIDFFDFDGQKPRFIFYIFTTHTEEGDLQVNGPEIEAVDGDEALRIAE